MARAKSFRLGRLVALALAVFVLTASEASSQTAAGRSRRSGSRRAQKSEPLQKQTASPSRYVGEPISLDLKDADIKDVLRTFAELTRLNIAIDPDVRGSVTVRLYDVPWDQALDVILEINGWGYVLEGNVLRVGKPAKLLPSPAP